MMVKSIHYLIIVSRILVSLVSARKFSLPLIKERDEFYASIEPAASSWSDVKVDQNVLAPSHRSHLIQPVHHTDAPVRKITAYSAIYTVNITLGTPPQAFRAVVDLNWADTFVSSSRCKGSRCDAFPQSYNSSASSTYTKNDTAATIMYVPVNGFGYISTDDLTLGVTKVPNLNFIELYAYDLPEPTPPELQLYNSVLGLALGGTERPPLFRTPKQSQISSPFRQMVERGILERNMFAVLWPVDTASVGDLMFGGYDERFFEGALVSHRLYPDDATEWSLLASAIYIGGANNDDDGDEIHHQKTDTKSFPMSSPPAGKNLTVGFTSQAPFIALPRYLARSLIDHIEWEPSQCTDYVIVNCDHLSALPDLIIEFGNQNITMHGRDYIVRRVLTEEERVCTGGATEECILVIASSPTHGEDANLVTLGMGFLKKVYTVFDWDERSISFGRLRDQ